MGVTSRSRVGIVAWDVMEADSPAGLFADVIRRGRDEFEFVVVATRLAPSLRPLVEWRRAPAISAPLRARWASFFLTGSLRALRAGADVLHVSGGMPLIASRADVISMHVCHASLKEHLEGAGVAVARFDRMARLSVVALERFCCTRARVLVSPSQALQADLARHFDGVPAVVVRPPVDAERFKPDDIAGGALRRELRVRADDVVVLFVARDWALKGLDVAMEAVAGASAMLDRRLWLWVVGDRIGRNSRDSVRARADELGLRTLLLAGDREDVERFYQAADVFLLPSISETYCRAAHEAAACQVPVVATPVGALRDLIGSGEAGILISRDASQAADALVRLGRDPELRAALGSEARRRVVQHSREAAAEEMLAIYRAVLDDP